MSDSKRFETLIENSTFPDSVLKKNGLSLRLFAAAVEKQTLERSAQLCEQLWTRAGDADQCADAIRALMENVK